MNIVKESNLGEIKSIFDDNSSCTHYYKIINNTFGSQITDLEFAKPIIQMNNGKIIWQSKNNSPFLPYASLSNEKKEHLDAIINRSLDKMAVKLADNSDKNFLDNITELPDENAIFYTKDVNNTIRVILTEWSFINDDHKKNNRVLRKVLANKTLKSFIVKFKSKKGAILAAVNCKFTSDDFNQTISSDNQGIIKLNNLSRFSPLNIISVDKNFENVSIDLQALEEYTITVNRNHTLTFKVIDSNNRPVKSAEFYFESAQFPNKKFRTDEKGTYAFNHPEFDGEFKIFSSNSEELFSENLPSEDTTYTIVYDAPIEENNNIIEEEPDDLEDPFEEDESIQLEFLNWRKKPIINQSIDLYGKIGKSTYITDQNGIIQVDSLSQNIEYSVFMKYKKMDWKRDFIHNGEEKHTFIVKMKRFLWWWLPLVLFFLALLLIPTQVNHHYTVLNKKTKQPITGANISSAEASIHSIQDYNETTDSIGKLSIGYGKFKLYAQIFKKLATNINVSKVGYESLETKVPLSFFKTRESIVYLNKLEPPTPPENSLTIDADYMVVVYEFTDGLDLDTRTRMVTPDIGQNTVKQCIGFTGKTETGQAETENFKNILIWGGDNQKKGFESVLIDFKALKAQFPETKEIVIDTRAWWYKEVGENPVKIFCKYYKGGLMVKDPRNPFLWINPTAIEEKEYRTNGVKVPSPAIDDEHHKGYRISVFNYDILNNNASFNDNDRTTLEPQ